VGAYVGEQGIIRCGADSGDGILGIVDGGEEGQHALTHRVKIDHQALGRRSEPNRTRPQHRVGEGGVNSGWRRLDSREAHQAVAAREACFLVREHEKG
jgi:hypothetical protein